MRTVFFKDMVGQSGDGAGSLAPEQMGGTVRTVFFKDMVGQSGDGARFFAYYFLRAIFCVLFSHHPRLEPRYARNKSQ